MANWVQGELNRYLNEQKVGIDEVALSPEGLGELVDLTTAGTINARTAKELFREVVASGGSPAALVEERGLAQVSDRGAVEAAVKAAMEAQPQAVEDFRGGNDKARGRIFGEAMKQLKGQGDPKQVNEVLTELLG